VIAPIPCKCATEHIDVMFDIVDKLASADIYIYLARAMICIGVLADSRVLIILQPSLSAAPKNLVWL